MPSQFITIKGIELQFSAGDEVNVLKFPKHANAINTAIWLLIAAAEDLKGEVDTVQVAFRNYKRAGKVFKDGIFWSKEEVERCNTGKPRKQEPVEVDKKKICEILKEVLKTYEDGGDVVKDNGNAM